jgi:hypothetical protein
LKQLHIRETGSLGDYKLLLQTESPLNRARTLTILTASDATALEQSVNSLVSPEIWNNLSGGMVLWRDKLNTLASFKGATEYHVGQAPMAGTLSYYFSNYPLDGLLVTIAVIIVAAVLMYLLLRRFARKRNG